MPSPTSSTLPTSARSTSLRYWRISSAMTDVISSTLNLIRSLVVVLLRGVGGAAVDLLRPTPEERCAQTLEARRHAGVDLLVTHPEDHAADQPRVDLLEELDALAGEAGGDRREPLAQRLRQGHRGAHVDVGD